MFMACLAADISGSSVLAGQLSIIDVRLAVDQAVGRICRGRVGRCEVVASGLFLWAVVSAGLFRPWALTEVGEF